MCYVTHAHVGLTPWQIAKIACDCCRVGILLWIWAPYSNKAFWVFGLGVYLACSDAVSGYACVGGRDVTDRAIRYFPFWPRSLIYTFLNDPLFSHPYLYIALYTVIQYLAGRTLQVAEHSLIFRTIPEPTIEYKDILTILYNFYSKTLPTDDFDSFGRKLIWKRNLYRLFPAEFWFGISD